MADITTPEIIDFPGSPTAVVRAEGLEVAEIAAYMDETFAALTQAIENGDIAPAGPAFCRYDTAMVPDETGQLPPLDLEAGFPLVSALDGPLTAGEVRIEPSELPACQLAVTKHTGPYDQLGQAWEQFTQALVDDGFSLAMPCWEAYDTEPTPDTDPATLVTGLAVPVVRD